MEPVHPAAPTGQHSEIKALSGGAWSSFANVKTRREDLRRLHYDNVIHCLKF